MLNSIASYIKAASKSNWQSFKDEWPFIVLFSFIIFCLLWLLEMKLAGVFD